MASLLAYRLHGSVMDIMNVLMAVMKRRTCVVRCTIFQDIHVLEQIVNNMIEIGTATWECNQDKFTCGIGHPRCIPKAGTCNKLIDCSDESDEAAALCGECHIK